MSVLRDIGQDLATARRDFLRDVRDVCRDICRDVRSFFGLGE